MKKFAALVIFLFISPYEQVLSTVDQDDWEAEKAFAQYRATMAQQNNSSEPAPRPYFDDQTPDYGSPEQYKKWPSAEELDREWNAQSFIGNFPEARNSFNQAEQTPIEQEEKAVAAAIENYKATMVPAKKPAPVAVAKISTVQKKITTTPGASQPQFSKKETEDQTVIAFGGYIKPEMYWDSRQVNGLRDNQTLFFPDADSPDVIGQDINSNGEYQMLAIQTRLNAKVSGVKLPHNTKLSGFIEVDFFGVNDTVINTPRMRGAFSKIEHNKSELLFGYWWHPILVEECNAADVISFNAGAPFESFSRNPQVRFTYHINDAVRILLAAITEVDFDDTGPIGQSTTYLQNAILPILHAQLKWSYHKHEFGVALDFRRLKPRLASSTDFKVDEHVNSVSAMSYMTLNYEKWYMKAKLVYAQNDFSYLMLGGYGISSVQPVTDERTYTPISNVSTWFELSYGKVFVPAIFIGYIKNLGALSSLAPLASVPGAKSFGDLIFGRGTNIDWMLRVSPRLVWNIKNLQVCAEFETTHAQFGIIQQDGKVVPNDPETNFRLLLATFYYF